MKFLWQKNQWLNVNIRLILLGFPFLFLFLLLLKLWGDWYRRSYFSLFFWLSMFMFSYSTCYNIVIIITFCVFELIINIKGVKTFK